MDIHSPLTLLGGLTAAQFMRRHWQKKPLLVRQAVPRMVPPVSRSALFDLAAQEGVESRLIRQRPQGWTLRHGPFARRALPPLQQPGWSLLVQGVDLHHAGAHALMREFRFLPDARLDDLMISYASDSGGVGPHFDSYDVFLLQASGRRRWSIGRQRDLRLQPDVPLKILAQFEPEESFVLEPGDMLYLPPRYAHDGVAVGGDCMTCSIGLRSPAALPLGADLLARMAEAQADALLGNVDVHKSRALKKKLLEEAHAPAKPSAKGGKGGKAGAGKGGKDKAAGAGKASAKKAIPRPVRVSGAGKAKPAKKAGAAGSAPAADAPAGRAIRKRKVKE